LDKKKNYGRIHHTYGYKRSQKGISGKKEVRRGEEKWE